MYALTICIRLRRFFFGEDSKTLMGNKEVNVILFATKQNAIDFIMPILVTNREIEQMDRDKYCLFSEYEQDGNQAPFETDESILIRYNELVLAPENEFLYIVEVDSKIPNLKA